MRHAVASVPRIFTVALVGNPNSGKTTIFNALTGLRQKVANYPGVTVERRIGRCERDGRPIDIIDLPGTYSLIPRSPDERVAVEVLSGQSPGTPAPDAAIVVVDASNLQRNLFLVTQLIDMRVPMVVALNMMDIAERRGQRVDADELSRSLGVPVVPVVAHKRRGLDQLIRALDRATIAPEPDWPLEESMRRAVDALAVNLETLAGQNQLSSRALAERLLCDEPVRVSPDDTIAAKAKALRSTLLAGGVDPMQSDIEAHYRWIEQIAHRATSPVVDFRIRHQPGGHGRDAPAPADPRALDYQSNPITLTEKADRILLHRVWGLVVFAAIMAGLFVSIFILADPIMGWTEEGIVALGALVEGWIPEGTLRDLWRDGIVAGVGGVVVFVPQIAILFLFLALLQDSGYLAPAAFLMDRVLGQVGLHGKSFIPLLSSFACAIPGIMATRTIENRRERLATIFVAPFMGCSARIPVYVLLIGTFFAAYSGWVQGLIMLGCYVLGVLAAVFTAWVWKLWTVRQTHSTFLLELPTYKVPTAGAVARVVSRSTWAFVRRAGTVIFCLSVILWALTYWPKLSEERVETIRQEWLANQGAPEEQALSIDESELEQAVAAEQLRQSYAGRLGHFIEPAIRPLGFDWKIGVGLVGSFAAREVFVSTMGIVYSVGEAEDDNTPLADAMRADTYPDGRPVWSPLVAATLLVWFVIAMQCMSTVAIVRRETGKWSWALGQLVYMNALAYVLCLAVFQIGRLIS
ncbi:MAG TPA: ferrous iron transport protein B [Tepidisphaeraceae bacterium]|nr:ferrous iron transport protein B [Tepidisphaeraceae bacterium]